jgi:hypothetical protein
VLSTRRSPTPTPAVASVASGGVVAGPTRAVTPSRTVVRSAGKSLRVSSVTISGSVGGSVKLDDNDDTHGLSASPILAKRRVTTVVTGPGDK